MERSRFARLTGVIFVVGAIFGLILSAGGLVVLWVNKANVTQDVTGFFNLTTRTLDATSQTVQLVSISLDQASTSLANIQSLVKDMASTMKDSRGLITDTANLAGGDMVQFVHETQNALQSVQTSARLIDDTLRVVSALPFIGSRYKPDVPLQDSIAKVSDSLDPLPESFTRIKDQLNGAADHMDTLQMEVDALAGQVDEISGDIQSARQVAEDYRAILEEVQTRYDQLADNLPLKITVAYLALTFILTWIFITQLGLLIHGIDLLL